MIQHSYILLITLTFTTLVCANIVQTSVAPRGWNSYDAFTCTVTETEVFDNAKILSSSNFTNYQYDYVVIDYEWFRPGTGNFACCGSEPWDVLQIDMYGRVVPSVDRYPSAADNKGFAPLAAQVHALGLKFGIHIMRGIPRIAVQKNTPIYGSDFYTIDAVDYSTTCAWCDDMWGVADNPAGQAYYNSIAALYASWGVDLIKMDCAYAPSTQSEILQMSTAIVTSGRSMVLSMSPTYNSNTTWSQSIASDVTMYRVNGDVWDQWQDVKSAFDIAARFYKLVRAPSFPDLDMLPLGSLSVRGGHGPARKCNLTETEQYTLMTLWSIFNNPLMFGGDMRALAADPLTLRLLTTAEILRMNAEGENTRPMAVTGTPLNAHVQFDIEMKECSGSPAQLWTFVGSEIHGADGSVLTVNAAAAEDGAAVVAERSADARTQRWLWDNEDGLIMSADTGKCLDVYDFVGPQVDVWECNHGMNQAWAFFPDGTLRSNQTDLCLTQQLPAVGWTSSLRSTGGQYLALFNLHDTVTFNVTAALPGNKSFWLQDLWSGAVQHDVYHDVTVELAPHASRVFYAQSST